MAKGLYSKSPPKTRRLCECGRDIYRNPATGRWESACRWCLELEFRGYGHVLPDYDRMEFWVQEVENDV